MTPEPHEADTAAFAIVSGHELQRGDTLLDLGTELTGRIAALRTVDLSEPGDHALVKLLVDLAWRGEDLIRTPIIIDQLDLRVIAPREEHR